MTNDLLKTCIGQKALDEDRAKELELWFEKYDMQVKQYERDLRLGARSNIHIDDQTYASINELDLEAKSKAEELARLRKNYA